LEVLRNQLDLTGAKPVSLDGSSGASTVLVDDRPITASNTLAIAVKDKKIRTVESLGGPQPDPVCHAFVEYDAQQCGFCTPGFVVAVRAFLDKNPNATEEQIRQGLNGNICRCGTYAQVIQAALDVVNSNKSNK
jgi:xanthine dehydrogenase YagT iron-sulfur-binding subunit